MVVVVVKAVGWRGVAWGGAGWVAWAGHSLQCLSRVRGMLMRRGACRLKVGEAETAVWVPSFTHPHPPSPTHKETPSLNQPNLHLPPLPKETISLPSSLPPSPSLLPSLIHKERCTPFIRLSVSHPNPSPPTRKLRPSLPSSPPPSVAFTLTLPHTQGKMYSLFLSLRNSP